MAADSSFEPIQISPRSLRLPIAADSSLAPISLSAPWPPPASSFEKWVDLYKSKRTTLVFRQWWEAHWISEDLNRWPGGIAGVALQGPRP